MTTDVDPDLAAILDNEGGEPEPAEPATPSDAPLPEAEEPAAPAEPEHPESVPWEDHVKLRHENENYRKTWQPIEKAFDGVHPEDREALLNLVSTYKEDPAQAAAIMRQYADALAANDGEAVLDDAPGNDQPLTRADLDRALAAERQAFAKEQQKAAEAQAVQQYERDAVALGYNPQSEDPVEASRYVRLLSIASKNGGDLQAADKVLTGERQKIIDEYLAAKKAESGSTPVPQTGITPSGENQITSLKDADKAAWELLTQQ